MRLRPALTSLILAAAATAGCGTTVPAAQRAAPSGDGLAAAAGPSAAAPDSGLGPADGPAALPGAVAPATSAGRDGTTPTAGAVTGTGAAEAPTGPGSPAAIEVGIGVNGNASAFAAAFGATQSEPDEKRVAEAVVADINATGGLAGHTLVPVYAVFDSTSDDWVAQDEAICAAFTQDHHVSVAVRTDDIFGPLDACLAKAGVPLVLWESVFRPPSWWSAAPGLRYTPDEPSGQRVYAALIQRMVATNRWTKASRIGLVRYDRNDQAQIERDHVRPLMTARGLSMTTEAVHTPTSFSDLGSTSSELAGAILRFRQAGVDNVMFMGGDISYLFANAAESQQYRPHYALTSFDFPNEITQTAQLAGAFGIGWEPSYDITSRRAPTPGLSRCERVLKRVGGVFDADGSGRLYIACDHLYFLQAAYAAAGRVGPGALEDGVRRLGPSFRPAFTFSVDAARHPDGLSSYADLRWDDGCSCLRYEGRSALP